MQAIMKLWDFGFLGSGNDSISLVAESFWAQCPKGISTFFSTFQFQNSKNQKRFNVWLSNFKAGSLCIQINWNYETPFA